jgi:putative addiction module antidote
VATTLKLTGIGNSVGVILPRDVLEKLKIGRGDTLYMMETAHGIELSPYDPAFEAKIEAAKRVMRKNRDALKKLAE